MNTRMTIISREKFLGKDLRIRGTIEKPLFKAAEVAGWLGHTNTTQMLKCIPDVDIEVDGKIINLRKENVVKIRSSVGFATRDVLYLTEYGVYFVLMKSRSSEAIKYQLKIMDVLRSLRLKGYAVSENISAEQIESLKKDAESKEELIKVQGKEILKADKVIAAIEETIKNYKNESPNTVIQPDNLF